MRTLCALSGLLSIYAEQGRRAEIEKTLYRLLEISREVGDRAGEAAALGNLAALRKPQGDTGTARKWAQ
jgi:hypothetical protein